MENEMIWSFSRITPACLYGWYKTYKEGDRGQNNAFSEYGTLAHDILYKFATGQLLPFEMGELFNEKFNQMEHTFPDSWVDLNELYYRQGMKFFDSFQGFDDNLLEAEEEYIFEIDGIKFTGFPDRIGINDKNELTIWDYKSSKKYSYKELQKKVKQLYLYSIVCKEKYGEYPKYLKFLHFRQNEIVKIHFSLKELELTKEWAVGQARYLKSLTDYPPNLESEFFCKSICNHRNTCKFLNEE